MGRIKWSLLVWVFVLVGATAYALQEPAGFMIAFPQGTYPESASIFYAIVRDGADGSLSSGIVTTKKGVFEYPLDALSEYVTPRNVLKSLESGKAPEKSAIPPKNLKLLISAQKTRVFDARGGPITYKAEFTEIEMKRVYEAILESNLLTLNGDFRTIRTMPFIVGRLRINVEGNIKEVLYSPYYSREHPNDSRWTRLKTVLDLIEEILRTKDANHNLPRHSSYEQMQFRGNESIALCATERGHP